MSVDQGLWLAFYFLIGFLFSLFGAIGLLYAGVKKDNKGLTWAGIVFLLVGCLLLALEAIFLITSVVKDICK